MDDAVVFLPAVILIESILGSLQLASLLVSCILAAFPAEFFQFQFIRCIGFVFFGDVILAFANRAN